MIETSLNTNCNVRAEIMHTA